MGKREAMEAADMCLNDPASMPTVVLLKRIEDIEMLAPGLYGFNGHLIS